MCVVDSSRTTSRVVLLRVGLDCKRVRPIACLNDGAPRNADRELRTVRRVVNGGGVEKFPGRKKNNNK